MQINQLRAALAAFDTWSEAQGHGIRVTLKTGDAISGDYFSLDNREANPIEGMFRIDAWMLGKTGVRCKVSPLYFVEIEQIAAVQIIEL